MNTYLGRYNSVLSQLLKSGIGTSLAFEKLNQLTSRADKYTFQKWVVVLSELFEIQIKSKAI